MRGRAAALPEPSAAALAASEQLQSLLRERIAAAGGWIPFSEFMRAALYEPGLGYYSGGSTKLGVHGDFVTAPELGDFFARALAVTAAPVLERLSQPQILELGAGTGQLAAQLLALLAARRIEIARYLILEPSADLRARQQARLARFAPRVTWIDSLEGLALEGLVLANEVADALPVERFRKTPDGLARLGVEVSGSAFAWASEPAGATDVAGALGLEPAVIDAWPVGYTSEYCPLLAPWVAAVAACVRHGLALIVDYGLTRRDYYRPERAAGTLMCHYRHRAHGDPFVYPGLQDITAWVDFSVCAAAAESAGLDVAAFTPQGGWLIEALARTELDAAPLTVEDAARLRTLVLPGEMGERFKLLALSRGVGPLEVVGRDLRNRL